jgi:hypothetical protein
MVTRRQTLLGIGVIAASISTAGCSGDDLDSTSDDDSEQNSEDSPSDSDDPSDTSETYSTDSSDEGDTPEPASFEVVRYEIPDTVEIGEEVTLAITIENTGSEPGDYTALLYARVADSDWKEGEEWNFTDVEPGETSTTESDDTSPLTTSIGTSSGWGNL